MKTNEINGFVLKLYEILNSCKPGLSYLPQYAIIGWVEWWQGHLCREGLENYSVIISNFYCNNIKFILNATWIWCNTEVIGKVTLPEANKTYDNKTLKIKCTGRLNSIFPMKLFLWKLPEEKLEILEHKKAKILCSSGQTYHKVQMAVNEGEKHYLFNKKYKHMCKALFGWLRCLFPSSFPYRISVMLFLIYVIRPLLLFLSCYVNVILDAEG